MKRRYQIVNLLAQDKSKTVGVARQQRHFLCNAKENEAKESLTLRLACLARYLGDINAEEFIRQSCNRSPLLDEALENLYLGNKTDVSAVTFFATGKQHRQAP